MMTSVGRTVMLYTDSTLADDFPSLRALLWKRKGHAVSCVIHGHDWHVIAAGFGAKEGTSLDALERTLEQAQLGPFTRHANQLYGLVPFAGYPKSDESLEAEVAKLKAIALQAGADLAAELVQAPEGVQLERHLASRLPKAGQLRLWAQFGSAEAAAHYARDLSGEVTVAGKHIVIEGDRFGPRLGFLAQRQGGTAQVLTSRASSSAASHEKPEPPDVVPLLRSSLKPDDRLETRPGSRWISVGVNTLEPGRVLKAMVELEPMLDLKAWISMRSDNPLAEALFRIRQDLKADTTRR